jgi:hypothetical protein
VLILLPNPIPNAFCILVFQPAVRIHDRHAVMLIEYRPHRGCREGMVRRKKAEQNQS